MTVNKEIRVAPNIYRSRHGWRVYVRRDGQLKPVRFKTTDIACRCSPPRPGCEPCAIAQLQQFVDTFKEESERLKRTRRATAQERLGTFAGDADRYLKLKTTKAMPSYSDRVYQIGRWVAVFGTRPRPTITTRDIDEQLQAFLNEGSSGSTVNKLRTALMAMWTRVDGRAAANPVRETRVFDEADLTPRGQSYQLLTGILAMLDPHRSRPVKGDKGSRARGSQSHARIELILWTGMDPVHLMRMRRQHFSVAERWYVLPPRYKGTRARRSPRPVIKLPMTAAAARAFERCVALDCFKKFDKRSLLHRWEAACRRYEKHLREKHDDPELTVPHIRLKDLRHSFGTEIYRRTKNLQVVADMLGITLQMARRYALGAVPDVLRDGMRKFEAATTRRPQVGNKKGVLPTRPRPSKRVARRPRASTRATLKSAENA